VAEPHRQALNRGYVLLPLAAPHHRRDGLVCFRPCTGQVVPALSRRRSRHTTSLGCPMSRPPARSRMPASGR
jgi:hypothetical protein